MIQSLLIHKTSLTCIEETANCQDVLETLESQYLRCAPVVDSTNTLYRGNIFRHHIYQHLVHYPDADLSQIPVTHFLKNTTRVVRETDPILSVLFSMMDLPYIAVLNKNNAFLGIIRHTDMLEFFAQSWTLTSGGTLLEVYTLGNKTPLSRITKLITKHTDINGCMTLDSTEFNTPSRIVFMLPSSLDSTHLHSLIKELHQKGFTTKHYPIQ